jgi:hypothetical protein
MTEHEPSNQILVNDFIFKVWVFVILFWLKLYQSAATYRLVPWRWESESMQALLLTGYQLNMATGYCTFPLGGVHLTTFTCSNLDNFYSKFCHQVPILCTGATLHKLRIWWFLKLLQFRIEIFEETCQFIKLWNGSFMGTDVKASDKNQTKIQQINHAIQTFWGWVNFKGYLSFFILMTDLGKKTPVLSKIYQDADWKIIII